LGYVGTAHEIAISLNSKDKLYHLHGICGVFQRPAKEQLLPYRDQRFGPQPHMLPPWVPQQTQAVSSSNASLQSSRASKTISSICMMDSLIQERTTL
jgi:hypothetical protein